MNIIQRFADIINHNKPVVIEIGACDGMHTNTRFFYTEISRANQYKDIGYEEAEGIMALLPGKWSIVENYGDDALFKNEALGS